MSRFGIGALLVSILTSGLASMGFAGDPQGATPSAAPTPAASTRQPPPPYTLAPVVVTATRTAISPENATSYVTELSEEQIEQSSQLVLDDLLRQVSGFNTFRRSSSIVTAPNVSGS